MRSSIAPTFDQIPQAVQGRASGCVWRFGFLIDGSSCTPLSGAIIDVWHCDALGVYSDVTDRSFSTVGQKFLRGYQDTNANGLAGL